MNEKRRVADSLKDYLADRRTGLPQAYTPAEAVGQIDILFRNSGGSGATFNFFFGDLSQQPLFAVSPFPDLSETVPGAMVEERDLKAFITKNQALLNDPRNNLGLWYDESRDQTWIDVSTVLPERAEAYEIGKRYNQIDGFDLQRNEAFSCGGSGEPVENLPTPTERLPELPRE